MKPIVTRHQNEFAQILKPFLDTGEHIVWSGEATTTQTILERIATFLIPLARGVDFSQGQIGMDGLNWYRPPRTTGRVGKVITYGITNCRLLFVWSTVGATKLVSSYVRNELREIRSDHRNGHLVLTFLGTKSNDFTLIGVEDEHLLQPMLADFQAGLTPRAPHVR